MEVVFINNCQSCAGAHLGFLEGSGPNFQMGANVPATNTVHIEKNRA